MNPWLSRPALLLALGFAVVALSVGCGIPPTDDALTDDALANDTQANDASPAPSTWAPFTVVTFNTGTSEGMGHDQPPEDGYSEAMAKLSDAHYGDGLAWVDAVAATKAWFAARSAEGQPIDLVGFQEIFYAGLCPDIPADAHKGFYCEGLAAGAPTVASHVLGDGYQVVCHPGKDDKCIGVRKAWGRVKGCDADFCLEGGVGRTAKGCGKGARVVRYEVELAAGGTLTVVHVHGSSGLTKDAQACREAQFAGIAGWDGSALNAGPVMDDGAIGLNGVAHVVLGDFNTDPHRFHGADSSARAVAAIAAPTPAEADGAGKPLHFVSPIGEDAPPTYGGIVNIDHILSDAFDGDCWSAGVSAGKPEVIDARYFDHKPTVCRLAPLP